MWRNFVPRSGSGPDQSFKKTKQWLRNFPAQEWSPPIIISIYMDVVFCHLFFWPGSLWMSENCHCCLGSGNFNMMVSVVGQSAPGTHCQAGWVRGVWPRPGHPWQLLAACRVHITLGCGGSHWEQHLLVASHSISSKCGGYWRCGFVRDQG